MKIDIDVGVLHLAAFVDNVCMGDIGGHAIYQYSISSRGRYVDMRQ